MTQEQRKELARKIEILLRKEWGEEFKESDVINIYNFCMDEAETNDVFTTAMQYEMKYG